MNRLGIVLLTVCFGFSALPAAAEDFDGTKALICASIETYECAPDADCVKGTAESINAPQFIRLDFKDMVARAVRPDGEERTSSIESLTQNEAELILLGTQEGLGWSMSITQGSGKMALSASGDRVAFVVFGACTTL
jgi:hypothetical protein